MFCPGPARSREWRSRESTAGQPYVRANHPNLLYGKWEAKVMRIPTTVFAAMLALVSSSLGRDLKFKELADVYLSNGKVKKCRGKIKEDEVELRCQDGRYTAAHSSICLISFDSSLPPYYDSLFLVGGYWNTLYFSVVDLRFKGHPVNGEVGTWFGAFRIPNLVPRSLVNIVGCSSRGRGNCGKLRATSNWASKPVIRSFPSAVRTVEKQLRALASSPPELVVFPRFA